MSWSRHTTPYQGIIADLADAGFDFDLARLPFGEAASLAPTLNILEGIAAISFLLTRSLAVLREPTHIAMATIHLTNLIVDELAESYSPAEMDSLVIPLLGRRYREYAALLGEDGEPGQRILACGRAMLARLFDVELSEQAQTVSARALFKIFAIEPGRALRQLDEAQRIEWRSGVELNPRRPRPISH